MKLTEKYLLEMYVTAMLLLLIALLLCGAVSLKDKDELERAMLIHLNQPHHNTEAGDCKGGH